MCTLSTTDFLTLCLVLLTGASVILTAIYAWLTWRILVANQSAVTVMRRQVEASTRPYVDFDLVPTGNHIEAVLRNAGVSAAIDLRVFCRPPLMSGSPTERRKCRIVESVIQHFSPGREFREFIGSYKDVKDMTQTESFEVTIDYGDSSGKRYHDEFTVDLAVTSGMLYLNRPDLPKEIQNIAKSLSTIEELLKSKSS